MLSPENYYQRYLRGKNAAQLITVIRSLKQKMGHLKNVLEHPDYAAQEAFYPSEATNLECTRLYLQRAKRALEELGVAYEPSQAERKAAAFEENLKDINRLSLNIGGFFAGYERRTYTLEGEELRLAISFERRIDEHDTNTVVNCTREGFLQKLRRLHLGEWRRNFNLRRFGLAVMDGTQWELELHFANGSRAVKITGDNAYPYNFAALERLFGMDKEAEELTGMERVVQEIVDYLLTVPEGTELSTSRVIEKLYGHKYLTGEDYLIHGDKYGFYDFLEINSMVYEKAVEAGLLLDDSAHDDEITGLHFHTTFIVYRMDSFE